MNKGRDWYAVYQPKEGTDSACLLRNMPWRDVVSDNIRITEDLYSKVYEAPMNPAILLIELRRQLEKELPFLISGRGLEAGDVLAVTRDGITTVFYVDTDRLVVLPGFFRNSSSGTLLTVDTEDYHIEGREGSWVAVDEIWIEGQSFFLMQSQKYGRDAAYAVVDSQGHTVADDTINGFSDEVIHQIRQYIQTQTCIGTETNNRPSLENWQKSFENGEYLRAAEMAEEQNYSMIDGRINNMPQRMTDKNEKRSVLKRLKMYQEEIGGKNLIRER